MLGADARWYGYLLAAISAGAIAGGAIAGGRTWSGGVRRGLMVGSLAALAVSLIVLGQLRWRWPALAVAALTGIFNAMVSVLFLSLLQRRTAPDVRGRVIGLHVTTTRALVPIALVAGGAIADMTGRNVPLVYGICGALALATVALLIVRPTTRAFLAD